MRFTIDLWDIGALLAIAAVLVGFLLWNPPAAMVFLGSAFLWVYFHREKALAAKQTAEPRE